jgi:hypothetical protein
MSPFYEPNLMHTHDRLATLEKRAKLIPKFDVQTVGKAMDAVSMDEWTLQTMVFEPAALKLHVGLGACPSSALPLRELDLKPLFSPAKP